MMADSDEENADKTEDLSKIRCIAAYLLCCGWMGD